MNKSSGQYAVANGLRIHYRDYGDGQPLILLHGGTDTHRLWDPFLPRFGEHFRVITPDSRGHGRTANPAGKLSYRMMADDLAGLIEVLELEKPFIFGYSDGGQAALDFGIRYSGTAKALVIGGVWYRFSSEYQDALKKAGFESPGAVDFGVITQNTGPGWIEHMRNAHPNPDPDYYQKFLEQICEMWWTPLDYSEEDLRKISAPTLILMGEKDEMIPVSETRELAQSIPGAELEIIPGASHNDVIREGGIFVDLVLDFFMNTQ